MPAQPVLNLDPSCAPPAVAATLQSLARDGALTQFQADELIRLWPELDEAWASHPHFRNIREHTRAFIGVPARRNRRDDLATTSGVA